MQLKASGVLDQLKVTRIRVGAEAVLQSGLDHPVLPGAVGTELRIVTGMDVLERHGIARAAWLCGGASMYEQFLPSCSDLFLTVVLREVEGDAVFPPFEDDFTLHEIPLRTADFEVRHFRRRGLTTPP